MTDIPAQGSPDTGGSGGGFPPQAQTELIWILMLLFCFVWGILPHQVR